MKYAAILFFALLLACGCNRNSMMTDLLKEQKFLKDSANNITEKLSCNLEEGVYQPINKQLGAVHTRLIAIQYSMDSLGKTK